MMAYGLIRKQFAELVTDYVEYALSPDDRPRFEWHLNSCQLCGIYLAQVPDTMTTPGRLTRGPILPQTQTVFVRLFRG